MGEALTLKRLRLNAVRDEILLTLPDAQRKMRKNTGNLKVSIPKNSILERETERERKEMTTF